MTRSFQEIIGVTPSKVVVKDSVLLIIDAQNEYINGQLKTSNIESTRKAIASLLEVYRKSSSTIIHIVHDTPPSAPIFTPSTPLAEIFSELEPKNGENIVHKKFPGSFTDTNLQQLIEESGKKQVVLAGYMAHVCVSTTARQAAERGYDVVLAKGAIGDRDIPGVKAEVLAEVVLNELADGFGTVIDSADIL